MTEPGRRPRLVATALVWLLVLTSVVSWRRGVLFSGAVDSTVLAKGAVAAVAAVAALALVATARRRRTLSPVPALLLGLIVAISLLGAVAAGAPAPGAVLAVRIAVLATAVLALLAATGTADALLTMLVAMASLGVFAAATGQVAQMIAPNGRDRLGGGIPPLEPNELATLVLPAAIALSGVILRRGIRPAPTAAFLLLSAVILQTGSRMGLLVLLIGVAVNLVVAPWLARGSVVAVLVALVGGYIGAGFTGVLGELVLRDEGVGRLLTLNSRIVSWAVVLEQPKDGWAWWLGSGLALKSVPVHDRWVDTQVFDSSWISSIAQDGVLGTTALVVLVAGTLVATARSRALRPTALALVATLVLRSFLENGLVESSVTFTVFFTLAVTAWPGTSDVLAERPDPAHGLARVMPGMRVLDFPSEVLGGERMKAPVTALERAGTGARVRPGARHVGSAPDRTAQSAAVTKSSKATVLGPFDTPAPR